MVLADVRSSKPSEPPGAVTARAPPCLAVLPFFADAEGGWEDSEPIPLLHGPFTRRHQGQADCRSRRENRRFAAILRRLAERVGFEPTRRFRLLAFQASALGR